MNADLLKGKLCTYGLVIITGLILITDNLLAQESPDPSPLFASDSMFEFELTGDVRSLFRDRTGKAEYFPFELTYKDENGDEIVHELKLKTRGNFRRKPGNCKYPPIWLNFPKNHIPDGSVFSGQNRIKLVMPCAGDSYVIKEYMVYKLLQLFTDYSFNARLIKVSFHRDDKDKTYGPMYGVLLEDEDDLAHRNNGKIEKDNLISAGQTNKDDYLRMTVFEYFVGNTDWSLPYRHNIKIIRTNDSESKLIPVPYDYDHAGLVNAPYANPAAELNLSSVRERRYRGYCLQDISELSPFLQEYVDKKGEIYTIINDDRLKKGEQKSLIKFIDSFFESMEKPERLENDFLYPCDKSGTGHIVIRGLNN